MNKSNTLNLSNKNVALLVPYVINNNYIITKENVKDIYTEHLTLHSYIIVVYNKVKNIKYLMSLLKNEQNFTSFYNDNGNICVKFEIPQNKTSICKIIEKCGKDILTSDMITDNAIFWKEFLFNVIK